MLLPLLALFTPLSAAAEAPVEGSAALLIVGAERMVPLVQELIRAFPLERPGPAFEVEGGGSAEGAKKLAEGHAAVLMSSRPLLDEEIRLIQQKRGRPPIATPIAMDAVVFFVPIRNPIASLTLSQLSLLLGPRPVSWGDWGIQGKKVLLHTPGKQSGSTDVVKARILGIKAFKRDLKEFPSPVELIYAVIREPDAIGFAGMRPDWPPPVRVIPLQREADSKPVSATAETVQSREYPLSHYLYLYVVDEPAGVVRDFIRFAVGPQGQAVIRGAGTGAVPLPMRIMKNAE